MDETNVAVDAVLKDVAAEHYLNHLAEVNNTNDVVTTDDIFNVSGVLLARKGMNLNQQMARKVAQHKLSVAVETQVAISNSLNTSALAHVFETLYDKHADLKRIHNKLSFQSDFSMLMNMRTLGPLLFQKLTVLQHQRPGLLDEAMYCAWLAAVIATEAELTPLDRFTAYAAALLRDVGMLHLVPALLDKTHESSYTPAEWRAMKSHAMISQIIIKEVPSVPPLAGRAILEHHERFDGMGYPHGKEGDSLGMLGQVVALADSLTTLRLKQFGDSGRNLSDTLAFLQMNAGSFHPRVHAAALRVLSNSGVPRSGVNTQPSVAALVAHLHDRAQGLQQAVNMLEHLPPELLDPKIHRGPRGRALLRTINQVLDVMTRSGLVSDELIAWLDTSRADANVTELVDMELMQNALHEHLGKARRALRDFFAEESKEMDPAWVSLKRYADQLWPEDNHEIVDPAVGASPC